MATQLIVPKADFLPEFTQGNMKAAMKDAGAKSRDLLMVPIDNLKLIPGLNIRIHDAAYEEHVEEVKESIKEHGFYQNHPLSGYAGREGTGSDAITFIYITGGFTRYDAAQRAIEEGAAIEELPVVLKPPGTSMVDITVALAMDNTGEPLRPYEKAVIVKRLIGYGKTEEEIAGKLKITEQYVKDLLYMMSLPQAVQNMVIGGDTTLHTAIVTTRKHGPKEAAAILKNALTTVSEGNGAAEPTSAATGRTTVTQGHVAASERGQSGIVPKGHYIAAIDYAIQLPGDGLDFLRRWRKGEKDAESELASTLTKEGKAKMRKAKKEREKAAEKAKREAAKAAKKATAKKKKPAAAATPVAPSVADPEDDAFDVDL